MKCVAKEICLFVNIRSCTCFLLTAFSNKVGFLSLISSWWCDKGILYVFKVVFMIWKKTKIGGTVNEKEALLMSSDYKTEVAGLRYKNDWGIDFSFYYAKGLGFFFLVPSSLEQLWWLWPGLILTKQTLVFPLQLLYVSRETCLRPFQQNTVVMIKIFVSKDFFSCYQLACYSVEYKKKLDILKY